MKKYFISLFCFFALISCEDIVDNQNLPYIEELVIRAILEDGVPVSGISITRTLPPLEKYDEDKALVRNAEAFIAFENVKYELSFDPTTNSYYNQELVVKEKGIYKLYVKWKGLQASAETRIPEPVEIDSFSIHSEYMTTDWDSYWDYTLYAHFSPKEKSAYAAYTTNPANPWYSYTEASYRTKDTLKNGTIQMSVYNIGWYNDDIEAIKNDLVNNNYYSFIDCYDEPFYNYYLTRYEGGSSNDIFGTSGANISGNIKGGIGLFIGVTRVSKKVYF